jgi:hypothetical protein
VQRLYTDSSIQKRAVNYRVSFLSEFSDIQVSGTSETAGRSEHVSSEWKNSRVEFQNHKRRLDLRCDREVYVRDSAVLLGLCDLLTLV